MSAQTPEITQQQIESFTAALIKADAIKESELKDNRHLIVEALKLSASKEGLQKVMYTYSDQIGSESTVKPAISAYNGQVLTGTTHEPIEIFTALYNTKKSEKLQREKQARDLIDAALKDWYYYDQRTPADKRYSPNLGGYITKEYFIENLYKCPFQTAGCMLRFKTAEEAQRHRYRHGG